MQIRHAWPDWNQWVEPRPSKELKEVCVRKFSLQQLSAPCWSCCCFGLANLHTTCIVKGVGRYRWHAWVCATSVPVPSLASAHLEHLWATKWPTAFSPFFTKKGESHQQLNGLHVPMWEGGQLEKELRKLGNWHLPLQYLLLALPLAGAHMELQGALSDQWLFSLLPAKTFF